MGLFSGGPCPLLTLIGIKDALVMVINTNCLRNSVIGGGFAAVSSLVGGGGRCVTEGLHLTRNFFLWATSSLRSWPST